MLRIFANDSVSCEETSDPSRCSRRTCMDIGFCCIHWYFLKSQSQGLNCVVHVWHLMQLRWEIVLPNVNLHQKQAWLWFSHPLAIATFNKRTAGSMLPVAWPVLWIVWNVVVSCLSSQIFLVIRFSVQVPKPVIEYVERVVEVPQVLYQVPWIGNVKVNGPGSGYGFELDGLILIMDGCDVDIHVLSDSIIFLLCFLICILRGEDHRSSGGWDPGSGSKGRRVVQAVWSGVGSSQFMSDKKFLTWVIYIGTIVCLNLYDMFWPFHFIRVAVHFFPSLNVFLLFVLFHVLWFYPSFVVPWSSL